MIGKMDSLQSLHTFSSRLWTLIDFNRDAFAYYEEHMDFTVSHSFNIQSLQVA